MKSLLELIATLSTDYKLLRNPHLTISNVDSLEEYMEIHYIADDYMHCISDEARKTIIATNECWVLELNARNLQCGIVVVDQCVEQLHYRALEYLADAHGLDYQKLLMQLLRSNRHIHHSGVSKGATTHA